MAPEGPTLRGQRALAGVTLACVLVAAGGTVAYALAGDDRRALAGLLGTVVGVVIFAADVWAIKHPNEYPNGWPATRRGAYIVLIVIPIVLTAIFLLL
jgi:hypothetical protein